MDAGSYRGVRDMKITEREFRIAAMAGLFGFLLCYFLFGHSSRPRNTSGMTLVASVPAWPQTTNQIEWQLKSINSPRFLSEFGNKLRPELREQPRPNLDLMSSRHRAEVDLHDLQ